jgi:hypothetical protein
MLFKEIISVYSEKYNGHLNLLCGDNVEFFNVTAGTCSYHCTLKNEVKAPNLLILLVMKRSKFSWPLSSASHAVCWLVRFGVVFIASLETRLSKILVTQKGDSAPLDFLQLFVLAALIALSCVLSYLHSKVLVITLSSQWLSHKHVANLPFVDSFQCRVSKHLKHSCKYMYHVVLHFPHTASISLCSI